MLFGSDLATRIDGRIQENLALARFLVKQWMEDKIPTSLFLETGILGAEIAGEIARHATVFANMQIYTTNILVAQILGKGIYRCRVLHGPVDHRYGCIVADVPGTQEIKVETAVIKCSGFSIHSGQLTRVGASLAFKRDVIDRCERCFLVIGSNKGTEDEMPLFEKRDDWEESLHRVNKILTKAG